MIKILCRKNKDIQKNSKINLKLGNLTVIISYHI